MWSSWAARPARRASERSKSPRGLQQRQPEPKSNTSSKKQRPACEGKGEESAQYHTAYRYEAWPRLEESAVAA